MWKYLLIFLFLFGCERTVPGTNLKQVNGFVESKEIKPSYITEEDDSTSVDMGDISITIPGTIKVYHPETYWVTFFYRNEKDEPINHKHEVTLKLYNMLTDKDKVRISYIGDPTIERIE